MKKSNGGKPGPKALKGSGLKAIISKKTGGKGVSTHKACQTGRYSPSKSIAHGHPKGRTILIPKNLLTSSGNDTSSEEEKRFE
ncbi:hypothetical protein [Dyadobacter sp. 32]|uniref:hypothetical protein n=1 Tax=Dyadobacter sp. 32 TaxID=538966 RepID=UPI0011F02060